MKNRYFLGGVGAGLLFAFIFIWLVYASDFSLPLPTFFIRPKPYNVIMISIDTLRADHMGAYGYSRDTSPNLDRFAEENILFEQAIAQAPWTLPSHMSLLTSQYPSVHGVVDRSLPLDVSKVTLAEVLKQNGYKTAAFVGGDDMKAQFGYSQGFDIYEDNATKTRAVSFTDTLPSAVEWLKQNKGDRFFLFVQGYDVHTPYHNPEPFEHMFDPGYGGVLSDHDRFYFHVDLRYSNSILHKIRKIDGQPALELEDKTISLEQSDINHIIAHYNGGIRYADGLVQQFLDSLKELGLYKNSIIIIFSDHGESLGDSLERFRKDERRLIGHGHIYEEIIHVPLLIRHPALQAQKITTQAQLIDLFPTLLDFLNIPFSKELKEEIQGESLVPLINGKAGEHFNEYTYGEEESEQLKFVRTSQWKLMRQKGFFVLYNLQHDPKETRDLIDQQPHIAEQLKEKLLQWELGNIKKKLGMD